MIQNLIGFDLKNYYTARYHSTGKIIVDTTRRGFICWGGLVHRCRFDNRTCIDIKIHIYKNKLHENINHYCIFHNTQDLVSYLTEITKYCNFEFTVNPKKNGFDITIKEFSGNRLRILWVLNLIRHTYEFPFNAFLKDALILRNSDPELKDEHIVNLIQTVATSSTATYYHLDQSLGGRYRVLKTIDDIKSSFDQKKTVTAIYKDILKEDVGNKFESLPSTNKYNNIPVSSWNYWFEFDTGDESTLEDRLKIYKHNYKLLKQGKDA